MSTENVVIVGAGQAGAWVARSLRAAGSSAKIVLIGAEPHFPYERPPLSKKVILTGDTRGIGLLDAQDIDRLDIAYRHPETVTEIDRVAKHVRTNADEILSYDKLVLSTGGRPRKCTFLGADLPNVYTLRNLDDALRISGRLRPGAHLLIVGGGWIGLELAAAARQLGADVTILESSNRLCERSVPPLVSELLRKMHLQRGVKLRVGTTLTKLISGHAGLLASVEGLPEPITADTVVIGIGIVPNMELACDSGLATNHGIIVDSYGRTSDPDIYAAGDVTCQPTPWARGLVRLESWANAQNQAIAVGSTLAGVQKSHDSIPWFWSDQYDLNLQVLGCPIPRLEPIIRGDSSSGQFCIYQLLDERIVSVVSWNATRELKLAKKLMAARIRVRPEDLTNAAASLEALIP